MKTWQIAGIHAVKEALRCRPKDVIYVAVKDTELRSPKLTDIVTFCEQKNIDIRTWSEKRLSQWAASHQNVVAEIKAKPEPQLESLAEKDTSLVLVLDGLEDPHNLGAILRSAWLLEADLILIPEDRAAKLSPSVFKVACGGAEHVGVLRVSSLAPSLEQLKEMGFWVYGLAEGGECNLYDWQPHEKCVLVIGAESKGMRKNTRKLCDQVVEIWQSPSGASYNASVAAALAMNTYRNRYRRD